MRTINSEPVFLTKGKLQELFRIFLKESNLLTAKQYAEKNNVSVWYVQKLCRTGKIKGYMLEQAHLWLIEDKKYTKKSYLAEWTKARDKRLVTAKTAQRIKESSQ